METKYKIYHNTEKNANFHFSFICLWKHLITIVTTAIGRHDNKITN